MTQQASTTSGALPKMSRSSVYSSRAGMSTMHCLQVDLHYNGFCNSVLWQLFHYVPLNMDSKLSETRTLQFQWAAHQEANRRFAQVGAVPELDGGW